jgi:hypothetical protein
MCAWRTREAPAEFFFLPCLAAEEALQLFDQGARRRTTAVTAVNEASSRSHAIFSVEVNMEKLKPREGTTTRCCSVLNLVDLAGKVGSLPAWASWTCPTDPTYSWAALLMLAQLGCGRTGGRAGRQCSAVMLALLVCTL